MNSSRIAVGPADRQSAIRLVPVVQVPVGRGGIPVFVVKVGRGIRPALGRHVQLGDAFGKVVIIPIHPVPKMCVADPVGRAQQIYLHPVRKIANRAACGVGGAVIQPIPPADRDPVRPQGGGHDIAGLGGRRLDPDAAETVGGARFQLVKPQRSLRGFGDIGPLPFL